MKETGHMAIEDAIVEEEEEELQSHQLEEL